MNISIRKEEKSIIDLPFGYSANGIKELGITNKYFTQNEKPWYPVREDSTFLDFIKNYGEKKLLK